MDRHMNELIKALGLNTNTRNNMANIQALKDMTPQERIVLYNKHCK